MMQLRRARERGHFDHGWLNTYHTFSFADYYDPLHMGFRSLRVINEDRVAPGQGFGMHGHRDMEIVTFVLDGALEHKDSLGNGSIIRPGELQRMTAGAGIRHSEFNPSPKEPVHLYQIWLLPEQKGLPPSYEQRLFDEKEQINRLRLVAAPDGADGSLTIRQDARLYRSVLTPGAKVRHALAADRHGWLQVLRGSTSANGIALAAGDGLSVSDEKTIDIETDANAELLLFDLI